MKRFEVDPQTFQYPTDFNMYISNNDIIKAINPWGIVEAVLVSPGILTVNHLFIVKFKQAIDITGKHGTGVKINSHGELEDTPFFLRGMHRDGIAMYNILLSHNRMAIDISYLSIDSKTSDPLGGFDGFHSGALLSSLKFIPDERLRSYIDKQWSEEMKQEIESLFTRDEKINRLLTWISSSGEAILQRGLSITSSLGNSLIPEISTKEIISNYTENDWIVTYSSGKFSE